MTCGANLQDSGDSQFTFEPAMHLGIRHGCAAGIGAAFGNFEDFAGQRGFNGSFNDKRIAVGNLTFELDARAYGHPRADTACCPVRFRATPLCCSGKGHRGYFIKASGRSA